MVNPFLIYSSGESSVSTAAREFVEETECMYFSEGEEVNKRSAKQLKGQTGIFHRCSFLTA